MVLFEFVFPNLPDSVSVRVGRLFARASSVILSDIAFRNLDELDDLEVVDL